MVCTHVDKPPLRWSPIVGDIVHNLRAALDHLVCQLTLVAGGDCESLRTQFVISHSPEDFDKEARRRLSLIDDSSKTLFEALQPYRALDWPQLDGSLVYRHPLASIQRLSNHDKHRLPLLSLFGPGTIDLEDIEIRDAEFVGFSYTRAPYRVGEAICTVDYVPTGPNPHIDFSAFPESVVSFDDGEPVLDSLESATYFVAGLLREFWDPGEDQD